MRLWLQWKILLATVVPVLGLTVAGLWSGTGERRPWDYPRTRLEAGLGARLSRGVLLKAI